MKLHRGAPLLAMLLLAAFLLLTACESLQPQPAEEVPVETIDGVTGEADPAASTPVALHPVDVGEDVTLTEALTGRKSTRDYDTTPLALADLTQLLWAAQGDGTDAVATATRTAPSAGATHPLELFVVAGAVEGLAAGVYHYHYVAQELVLQTAGDIRKELARAALGQEMIARAPAVIIIAAEFQRTTQQYGARGDIYVYMESGSVAQNIALQAAALGIGNVVVGAFHDDEIDRVLQIDAVPLLIIPVGYPVD
jgi:SagB-type dehydrogenase family enzyme